MRHRFKNMAVFSLVMMGFAMDSLAAVTMPSIFGDSMVVQRGIRIPVWGWASPWRASRRDAGRTEGHGRCGQGRRLEGQLGSPVSRRTADVDGDGPKRPHLHQRAGGEVWICSGQSWMTWEMARVLNAEQECREADYPQNPHVHR